MPSVFISYTRELGDYPDDDSFYDAAERAVISLGHGVKAQPYMSPEPLPPATVCARTIGEADYVVFLVGFQWGSAVTDRPDTSYVQLEYEEAKNQGKPRFVFLISEEARNLPPAAIIDRQHGEEQLEFRKMLLDDNQVLATVADANGLSHVVYKALRDWEDKHGGDDDTHAAPESQPPPFDDIALALRRGRVIPFLGRDAGLPLDYTPPPVNPPPKKEELVQRFSDRVPSELELSLLLADYSQYPPGHRLALSDVASYYSLTSGAMFVRERLHEAYDRETSPRPLHHYLAGLDTNLLIFVAGFDDLMERAFDQAERPYTTVIQPVSRELADKVIVVDSDDPTPRACRPSLVEIDLDERSVIYKPHGSFNRQNRDWDHFVATEDSNIDVLGGLVGNAIPDQFYEPLMDKQFLFLAVRLDSWTTRSLLSRIKADNSGESFFPRLNEKSAWAVRRDITPLEARLWDALRTKAFDMDLERFVEGLKATG